MYAEILLPQKIITDKQTLTYQVPENLETSVRKGLVVDIFVRNKKQKGIIYELHNQKPSYNTRLIENIDEKTPHLAEWQVELLTWISNYYFCPLYKVLKLFFVTSIKHKKELTPLPVIEENDSKTSKTHNLTESQAKVVKELQESIKSVHLIHGITGSGKTIIYRHLTKAQLNENKQVLILVPEISLTPQTFLSFQEEFNDQVVVIHSQLTKKQKEKCWFAIHQGRANIIIGSRSALFAPFKNLGSIIIDEEHEPSYKQDQAPRYHARDVSRKIGELLKIQTILGSATPSLESYYAAEQGIYGLSTLSQRVQFENETTLPETTIIDLREELKKKNFSIFSDQLKQKLAGKLIHNEQALLFLNRRGAASAVLCRECGYIEKCENCEIAMTYHRELNNQNIGERLICHHCGKIKKVPTICPNCQSTYIRFIGLGTQRIEDEIKKIFGKARVIRADKDTVQHRDSFKEIYKAFKNHEADILIGTQMVAKGLHLPLINLVGVILAELSLTLPDFRSTERTFQLLTQVSGRAGRSSNKGEVIIQTYTPENDAIQKASKHDYLGFYANELTLRKKFDYPPFTQLIKLTFTHANSIKAKQQAEQYFESLQTALANTPEQEKSAINSITIYPAFLFRLNKKYRWHILITGINPHAFLQKFLTTHPQAINMKIDVDPMSTL